MYMKIAFDKKNWKRNLFFLFLFLFFFKYLLIIINFSLTKFEKEITIKKKYIRPRRKSVSYMIIDENDILYKVNNLWFIGDFNRAEDWAKVNVNGKYNVKGYGFRFPFLDIYPIIYNIQ
jgi:hypothetical protein